MSNESNTFSDLVKKISEVKTTTGKAQAAVVVFPMDNLRSCAKCPCFIWNVEFKDGTCKAMYQETMYQEENGETGRVLSEFRLNEEEYRPAWCPFMLL
jgi:hypothetical protein